MRVFLLIGILLIFSLHLSAKDEETAKSLVEEAQRHYLKGKEYSLKGDYISANEEFRKAEDLLKKFSPQEVSTSELKNQVPGEEQASSLMKKAQTLALSNKTQEAIELYLELLRIFPDNPDIHYNLATQYLKSAKYEDASQAMMQVIKLNPKDKDAYYNLGILYELFLNDTNLAITYYKKYLELNPKAVDRKLVESWIESLQVKKR